MKVFLFMGLPYQGKSTIAQNLYNYLPFDVVTYVSTDGCRSEYWINADKEGTFDYSAESEKKSWKLFLDKVKSWVICSPPDSYLILDGTMSNAAHLIELFEALTLNIDFASSILVVQIFIVGSTDEKRIWKPVSLDFGDPKEKINTMWKKRCEIKKLQKIDSYVPDQVFANKVIEMRNTLETLPRIVKSFVKQNNKKLICTFSHLPHHAKMRWKAWIK